MAIVFILVFTAASLFLTNAYPWDNTCQTPNTLPSNIDQYCAMHPNAKVPFIDDCSAYYDCAFSYGEVPRYYQQHMLSCSYPFLFDPVTESCQPYSNVSCCDRLEPLSPCEYRQYKCKYAHCEPCEFNRPSCIGMSDGRYAIENRPRVFFECQAERTMAAAVQSCPQDLQFDPRGRQCAPAL